MNPNHGKYLDVVHHAHDGCQWNPVEARGALITDRHFRNTSAAMLVGSTNAATGIQYRLCAACAALPQWNRPGQSRRLIVGDKHA
jgi:hypothetical protein